MGQHQCFFPLIFQRLAKTPKKTRNRHSKIHPPGPCKSKAHARLCPFNPILWDGCGKKIWIIEAEYVDNAHGAASFYSRGEIREGFVKINRNPAIRLPVLPGRQHRYRMAGASFEAILWHELVGHAILGLGHPKEFYNKWDTILNERNNYKLGLWARYTDPTIAIENQARNKLGEPLRAQWYYNWDEHTPLPDEP